MFALTTASCVRADPNHFHAHTMAHYNLLENRPQAALDQWKLILEDPTIPVYAYKGFLQFLFATGQYKTIVSLKPQLETIFEDDVPTQLIFGQALAETGQEKAADEKFITLQQQHKTNQELTYLASISYSKTSPQKAIDLINEYLKTSNSPRDCIFHFLLSQLSMSLNNPTQALKHIEQSVNDCPGFGKGWLALGFIQEQQGKINEAIAGYTRYLQLVGSDKQVEQQLQKLLLQAKLNPQSAVPKQTPPQAQTCMVHALTQYEVGNYPNALLSCDTCLKEMPDNQEARLLKVHILTAMSELNQALELLEKYILAEPENQTWYKALHLLHHAGLNIDKVISVFKSSEKSHPTSIWATLYLADIYRRMNSLPEAIAYHNKAFKLTDQAPLKAKILFNLASIYWEQEQFTEMKKVIDQAVGLGTDFPPLQNLLAYYYASKGANLSLAQHHIDVVLKKDPKNPHFLDTQALIWYRQHNYQKAETLLTQLTQKAPGDYFIHYHLAQTYQKMGKSKEAYTTLEKTLTLARSDLQKEKCIFLKKLWNR